VPAGTIDLTAIRHDRDQLWAEAKARSDAGEPHWLDHIELMTIAKTQQRARYEEDAWQTPITAFVATRGSAYVGQILAEALQILKTNGPSSTRIACAPA
jgi:predicted P-loop ATPase